MYKNAMKNTKTTAVMEIKCRGGGVCVCVCVCVCVQVHSHVSTPSAGREGYFMWSGHRTSF